MTPQSYNEPRDASRGGVCVFYEEIDEREKIFNMSKRSAPDEWEYIVWVESRILDL